MTNKNIDNLSQLTKLRKTDIKLLQKMKIIDMNNMNQTTIDMLKVIEKLFFSNVILKRMLSYRTKKTRQKLIETSDLNKVESYVYTRLKDNVNDRKLRQKVLSEIRNFYSIPAGEAKKIVRKIVVKLVKKEYYQRKKNEKKIEQ